MTSKLNHGDGSYNDSASKPIKFFKIMLPDIMQEKLQGIPGKFVRKYGKHLPNTMFLKLPNGAEWKVNLVKHDGCVWFEKGWKEFLEYHCLGHGHLLVFRYDGTSHFHVIICDLSAMEIDYPVNKVNHKSTSNGEEVQPPKTSKTNGNNKDKSNSNLKDTVFHQRFRDYKGRLNNPNEQKRNSDFRIERSSISNCRSNAAASNNTSFTVIMKSSHLMSCMYLSKGSLKGYIKPGGQIVTLVVGDRSWRVKLIHYQQKSTSYFTTHWSTFVKENHLQIGDVCLFELLNISDEMVIKVSISKHFSDKP